MPRYFVLLEAGAKQAFVFASNKQAVNVGASELILRVGREWAREAAGELGVEVVLATSGKALLLAESPAAGRAVVRAVTERVLSEAPGLDVWGMVDEEPIGEGSAAMAAAVARVHEMHRRWRAMRPAPSLRHPTLPFVQPCVYSGLPATAMGRETNRADAVGVDAELRPRAAAIQAAWGAARLGRERMAGVLTDAAVLDWDRLDRGVTNAGWIAVVHADGNGIGQVFGALHRVYEGQDYLDTYRRFSEALDTATRVAMARAVETQGERTNWILPVVIGGDDLTAIMDGRAAFPVTVEFLRAFEEVTAADPVIAEVVTAVAEKLGETGPASGGLTAAAGVVFVKPHHPFSDAYELAEQLCVSAKSVKRLGRGRSAVDFHVLHDSVGRVLTDLRRHLEAGDIRLWSGPFVVTDDDPANPVGVRHVARLETVMAALRPGEDDDAVLPIGAVHQLREALTQGEPAVSRARAQVLAWSSRRRELAEVLDGALVVRPPDGDRFSRVLDALDLFDMEAGTVEGREREAAS